MGKILILMAVFVLVLTNCKKDKGGNAVSYDVGVGISYRDKSGNDLLDPNSKSGYYEKDIHIYQVINGVKSEYVPERNLDQYGNNQKICKDTLHHCYGIGVAFLNPAHNGNNLDTVLIELNKNIVDTATAIVNKNSGGIQVMKVWYNGVLKWELKDFPLITIVK